MTIHYSKFKLNTYYTTPYFEEHAPPDYPLDQAAIASRTYRNLPPNLKKLAVLAKKWAIRKYPQHPAGIYDIESFYDDEGYELDPATGKRLTDEEIDRQWKDSLHGQSDGFKVEDIPVPAGDFADPDTWEPPSPEPDDDEDTDIATEQQVLSDIKARGREYVAKYYGFPKEQLAGIASDRGLARAILDMRGAAPASS